MFRLAIVLSLLLSAALAEICPPGQQLHPCTCDEGLRIIECRGIRGRFDIKAVFDRASLVMDTSAVFEKLVVFDTSLLEVPADAITNLKFRVIDFSQNQNLEYISPNAFRDTHPVTIELSLWGNYLNNDAPHERDIYDFFNQFVNAEKIWLPNNRITSVPDHAFAALPHLKQLYLGSNSITHIGNFAFAGLSGLEDLWMNSNDVNAESVALDAFSGINPLANVDLEYNNGVTYLDEQGFGSLLKNAHSVVVGGTSCGRNGCSHVYLTCDSKADWICYHKNEFKAKLTGFLCKGEIYADVWAYCDSLTS